MEALIHLITNIGFIAVLLVIFAESGLLIGFFLPGDSLLFTSGFLVQQDIFQINIHLFVGMLFIAAVLGDSVGYAFGRRVGRKLFERPNSRFFKTAYLKSAEDFYDKHGSKAIILARFVPIVRTFAPIVAGTSHMNYRKFITFNIIGGLLWTTTFTYIGFFAGQKLTDMGFNIEFIALGIVAISVAPMVLHILADKDRRLKIWRGTKLQVKTLLTKSNK